jgi:hypothetical protein
MMSSASALPKKSPKVSSRESNTTQAVVFYGQSLGQPAMNPITLNY